MASRRLGLPRLGGQVAISALAQAYSLLVGLLMLPVLLRILGPEVYGLVGLYLLVQTWFQLLDFGFGAALGRETARHAAGAIGARDLWRLVRSLEVGYLTAGLVAAALGVLAAGWVVSAWLRLDALAPATAAHAVALLALAVPLRWWGTLYCNVLVGLERHRAVSVYMAVSATARFVLCVPVILASERPVISFFEYQVGLAALELLVLGWLAYRWLPPRPEGAPRPTWQAVRAVIGFSGTLALSSLIWIVTTQADKLLLSKTLALADFGHFTLVAMLANGLFLLAGPFAQTLQPRLTLLCADGQGEAASALYLRMSLWLTVPVVSAAAVLALAPADVLRVWTGSTAADAMQVPLVLYALGNALAALGGMAYYLQYGHGVLKMHLWGHIGLAVLALPLITLGAAQAGAIGTGWAWLLSSAAYLLLWLPVIHRELLPGMHLRWLLKRLAPPALAATACAGAMAMSRPQLEGRLETGCWLAAMATAVLLAATATAWLIDRKTRAPA